MKNYLQELNSEQQKAVLHIDGPLIVIAGADLVKLELSHAE